jgi:calcineurin-like phosphoesterase family protein
MNLYISDLHFGHKNVILFEHRPFSGDRFKFCVNVKN